MIFDICVEKGSELPPNDPNRKFKGRVVFEGNRVQDESWNAALFQELGSSPATMEAGKACDAYGLAPGHDAEQADAEQAYIQSRLGGDTPTWVRLPRERQPASWSKYRHPVCPLILALYGHPDSVLGASLSQAPWCAGLYRGSFLAVMLRPPAPEAVLGRLRGRLQACRAQEEPR